MLLKRGYVRMRVIIKDLTDRPDRSAERATAIDVVFSPDAVSRSSEQRRLSFAPPTKSKTNTYVVWKVKL